MIEFTLFDPEERHFDKVYVNPEYVMSVAETERRRTCGFYQPCAVLLLSTGEQHVVYDHNRDVAKKIMEAKR